MADETKSVILDVKLDIGDSAAKAAELRDTIIQLKEAQKENKRETQEQKALYEATDASIKSHTERLALLTQGIKNQETATKSNAGSFNQLQASLKVGEAQLKQLTGTMQKNSDGTIKLTKEYFDAKKQVDEAKNALLLFNAGISQGNLNVGNYDNTLAGMRQKLADLQVVIENTNVNDINFEKATADAAKLSTEIQIASGKIDAMGQKIAKNEIKDNFNDMRGAAQGLTGAIGILSLGFDSQSKTGEILRSVMVGLTVSQTALTIAENKADIQKVLSTVKTKALTAATWIYDSAIRSATIAATLLKAALASLAGIGLIIGIKRIIDSMNNQAAATQLAIDKQKEYNDQRKQENDDEIARLLRLEDATFRFSQRQKNIAENESKGNDVTAMKLSLYEDQVDALKNLIAFEDDKSEKYKLVSELIFERELQLNNLQTDIHKTRMDENKELNKSILDDQQKMLDAFDDYYNSLIDLEQKHNAQAREDFDNYWQSLYDEMNLQKQKTVILYDDMGEEIGNGEKEWQEFITDVFKKETEKRRDILISDNEDQKDLIIGFAQEVGNIFADSLTETGLNLKKFFANLSILILDSLEKTIIASQVEILAKQIASKGFAGIATSAIQIGLITAAFEGVKALITQQSQAQFYEGGYTGDGDPREQSLALGKKPYIYHKKEYVVNHELLENPFVAQQVSIIESMRKNNPLNMGLIGKADGGFASNFSRSLMNQQSLSAADIAQIKMFVSVTDINNMQNSVKVTESISGL